MKRSARQDVIVAAKDVAAKLVKGKEKDVQKLLEKAFLEGVKWVDKTAGAELKKLPEEYDRRKKMLSDDWKMAEDMYFNQGESCAAISRKFNVTAQTIWLHFNPDKKKEQYEKIKLHHMLNKPSKETSHKRQARSIAWKRSLMGKGLI